MLFSSKVAQYKTPAAAPIDFEEFKSEVKKSVRENYSEGVNSGLSFSEKSGLYYDAFCVEAGSLKAVFKSFNLFSGLWEEDRKWSIEVKETDSLKRERDVDLDHRLLEFLEDNYTRDSSKDNYLTSFYYGELGIDEDANPTIRELNQALVEES